MNDYQSLINWFPGHMAKAKRLLADQIKRTDLVIEICDARLPSASRNPELIRMSAGKQHLLILNKADLADPGLNRAWVRCYREQGLTAYLNSAGRMNPKEIIGLIEQKTGDISARSLAKGVRKTIRAMIVGIPNVGKSTVINQLKGRSVMQTGDRPGVTRSNQWARITPYLELLDTPGLLWPKLDDQLSARRLCYIGSVKDDVVDLAELTIHLLEDLCGYVPDRITERFHIQDPSLRGVDLLDAVCVGRGWLLKGAQPDYDRCCRIVLDEYRAGKLGRITFEMPPENSKGEQG